MIDPNDLPALWAAVRKHPDTIALVAWTVDDIRNECVWRGIDFDSVDVNKFDLSGWEDQAVEDGWEYIINVLYEYEGEVA